MDFRKLLQLLLMISSYCATKSGFKVIGATGDFYHEIARQNSTFDRQSTKDQKVTMKDFAGTDYIVDSTTFSLQPPELLCVRMLQQYATWFVHSSCSEYEALEDLEDSPWIDGACRTIRIRLFHPKNVNFSFHPTPL